MQRIALGVLALVLFVAGSLGAFTGVLGDEAEWWGGVAVRAGAILAVFWLVMPKAGDVSRAVWVGLGIFAAVLAIRPRLVLFGIVLAFIAMVFTAFAHRRTRARR